MKNVIYSQKMQESEIFKNLIVVKNIVATVKHASYNDEFSDSFSSMEEVETRVRTTHHVVKRFPKSATHL